MAECERRRCATCFTRDMGGALKCSSGSIGMCDNYVCTICATRPFSRCHVHVMADCGNDGDDGDDRECTGIVCIECTRDVSSNWCAMCHVPVCVNHLFSCPPCGRTLCLSHGAPCATMGHDHVCARCTAAAAAAAAAVSSSSSSR